MAPHRPLRGCTLTLIVGVFACGDSSGSGTSDVTVTDSLGIAVRTFGHTEPDLASWSHDPDPVLQLGALEGDTPDVFGEISSLSITADGGVVVSDPLAGEIRSFSSAGEPLGSFGRLGEGPGEFSTAVSVLRVSGDSVWAWDQRQQRASLFVDGTFVSSWSSPRDVVLSRPVMVGGRVFGESNARLSGMPESGMSRPSVHVLEVLEDGSAADLLEIDGHERFLDIGLTNGEISRVNVFQPAFARGPFFGVVDGGGGLRIIGGPNDRLVLREWSVDGELRAVHRYPAMDRPVTDAVLDRARRRIRERHDDEPNPLMQQELNTLEANVPEFVPAFDRVSGDDQDRLWVRRSAEDGVEEWLVLAATDLTPLARIVLPPGFALFDVRGGLLGGRWMDALDVSHVQLLRLRTGG